MFSYFNEEIISSRKDTYSYSKRNPNVAYNRLMRMFSKAYDTSFPEIQKLIKTKSFPSPWITKGIQISKRKQKLDKRFLKKWTYASEKICKYCKNLFEKVRNIPNKLVYKSQLLKYESDIKRTCNIIKEVIRKSKVRSPFPNKTMVDIEIKDNSLIAERYKSCGLMKLMQI